MIDTHHFHRAKDQVSELAKVPKEWFHYLHLCDASGDIPDTIEEMTRVLREERLYLGEGGINIQEIVRQLPNIPCSIELPHVARAKEMGYAEHAARCLESSKRYFSKYELG